MLTAACCAMASAAAHWPGIFLEAATVPRVKALALDAALAKGWYVAASGRDFAVFETVLEEPASQGPPNAVPPESTLLRIRGEFVKTPAGVNAYLYAEEIWYAGSSKEWVADVTDAYRGNLGKALTSLQARWDAMRRQDNAEQRRPVQAQGQAGEQAQIRVTPLAPDAQPVASFRPEPAPEPPAPAEYDVGTWAYYAEQFAIGRGCEIGDTGAVLLSTEDLHELHRVPCTNGPALLVRCDGNGCDGAR
jgi:hypothetical protein